MKYVFPSGAVIKKGGYLLITANKDGNGMTELNTGFALSKLGETLILSSPAGNELQRLEVPSLAEDDTYVYAAALCPGISKDRIEVFIDDDELVIESKPANDGEKD